MLLWQVILIHFITFIAIVFVLRRILFSVSFIETRRLKRLSEENMKKAQELEGKIEAAEKQYQERLIKAENEVKKLKAEAKEEADKLKEEQLSKARNEAERIINQALNAKEKMREEVEFHMQEKAVQQSLRIIQQVLNSDHQKLVHEGFVDEVLSELEKIEPEKLRAITESGELITPYEINKEKKDKIINILSKKTNKSISLEKKIDKEVISGIIIKLGSVVIDGSLAGKLKEAQAIINKG